MNAFIHQSINQSVSQSVSQSASQSVIRSLRLVSHSVNHSGEQSNSFYKNAYRATFTCVAIIHIQFPLQPQWETDCHLCHQSSHPEDSPLNPCRICPRVYHTKCLESRGYLSEKIARESLKLSTTPIGWSCFDCVSIG